MNDSLDLSRIYRARFAGKLDYRKRVWKELASFLSRWIPRGSSVLDLGCGNCEFINSVVCRKKLAMDLNPDAALSANSDVELLPQDCSKAWPLAPGSLDIVFTSNFFEHLPNKELLMNTLSCANAALRPGGCLIAIGPNIRYTGGRYWDFFDHYIPLSDASLSEGLQAAGFEIQEVWPRFLPYTMSQNSIHYPMFLLKLYLALPFLWRIFGKQFLIIARKPI